jgi:hypothetical protein
MGASTFSYSCGDGHQILRKQGWKKYISNNQFNVDLSVSNGIVNSDCFNTISITTGIDKNLIEKNMLIFPNPSTNNLTIETPQKATIEIINIQGQIIKTLQTTEDKTSVDISALAGGVYILKLTGEEGSVVRKFVKD